MNLLRIEVILEQREMLVRWQKKDFWYTKSDYEYG